MEQQKNEHESMRLHNIAQEQRINIQQELNISCEEYYQLIKDVNLHPPTSQADTTPRCGCGALMIFDEKKKTAVGLFSISIGNFSRG
jgi:hypothetical protein